MRRVIAGLFIAATVLPAHTAGADPVPLPDPPPYLPGAPLAEPGSFDYPYNVIDPGPPQATDSRGTRIGSNADPAAQSTGLPGSRLGNGDRSAGPLVTSDARYGISAGLEPTVPTHPEAAAPTGDVSVPPPLELPGDPHATVDGA